METQKNTEEKTPKKNKLKHVKGYIWKMNESQFYVGITSDKVSPSVLRQYFGPKARISDSVESFVIEEEFDVEKPKLFDHFDKGLVVDV